MFSRRDPTPPPQSTTSSSGGLFSRNRRNSSHSSLSSRGTGGGFLGMGGHRNEDPSIRNARQRITDAETAEKDADRALVEARNRVRLAREHCQMLEREALEE